MFRLDIFTTDTETHTVPTHTIKVIPMCLLQTTQKYERDDT